ncbi:zinc finger protein 438-like isoform X3 [Chiloscyllium plagiosum]|nr:zinc finger protein 438-like isoform X3 [Chiloscyllium plagiosum]XP_043546523.1 zinc finger protein 438-like isoform X3 [Chiloscyllium plagiosum]XP_043546524.1 zinc finger protein 438-like isoform X3 [Chiloscyllium plagiosum]
MSEDPNGYAKEIDEEYVKKEQVFQDEKHEDEMREDTITTFDQATSLQNETKQEVDSVDDSQIQSCEQMQDFIHDSSKAAGLQLFHLNQNEKQQVLPTTFGQHTQEKHAAMTDGPNSVHKDKDTQGPSSTMTYQKKSLSTKGHFRTIAPKVIPSQIAVSASSMVPHSTMSGISCGSTITSDIQTNTYPTKNAKPIIMPARSYALMPIAGKEGTYSLVALPQVAAATPQVSSKVTKSVTGCCTSQAPVSQAIGRTSVVAFGQTAPPVAATEKLKLPIPRYQSVWAKPAVKQGMFSKLAVVKPSNLQCQSCMPGATSIQVQPSTVPSHSNIHSNMVASKTGLLLDVDKAGCVSADITVPATLSQDTNIMLQHSSPSKCDVLKNNETTEMDRPMPQPGEAKFFSQPSLDSLSVTCSVSTWPVVQTDRQSSLVTKCTGPVGSVPLMQFGNSVQFIAPTPAPKGKVPILPYSRMKNTIFHNPKQNQTTSVTLSTQFKAGIPAAMSVNNQSKAAEMSKNICMASDFHRDSANKPDSPLPFIPTSSNDACISKKRIVDQLKKPNSNVLKHRLVSKRKMTDNVPISKVKRFKTCNLLSRMQEDEEKIKANFSPQDSGSFKVNMNTITNVNSDKTAEVLKKFCNIMPKPVAVTQAVAPLALSGRMFSIQNLASLKPETALNDATISKTANLVQVASTSGYYRNVPDQLILDEQEYKCHVCNRGFQLKHHLQDHLNIHSKSRPYCCRVCHKAYSHSGSLSTHMKRCHSEVHRKKLMCCEFCAKLFGHIGVYLFHLKEIHKVLISNEHSNDSLLPNKSNGDRKEGMLGAAHHLPLSDRKQTEDSQSQAELVGLSTLQIKCARCQVVTPTFVDMKLHLLCAHEEELQLRVEERSVNDKSRCISGFPIYSSMEAEQELLKHAANYWKQLGEKKSLVRCDVCEEAFQSCFKLKKHMSLHYKQQLHSGAVDSNTVAQANKIQFITNLGFNCILCKQNCGSKSELFRHWQSYHKCKDPAILWTVFSSLNVHCTVDEELPNVSPEHTAVSTEPFCRHIVDSASQYELHNRERIVDECKVHLSNCSGEAEGSLDYCHLTCPFCLKTFYCVNWKGNSGKEVVFQQEDVMHQCPKCLLKFSLTAKGLGAQVLCTSSKHCD